MYEKSLVKERFIVKFKSFFTAENASWLIFLLLLIGGIIAKLFLWDFTSSDMDVWREAAKLFIAGKNPYEETLLSFQIEGMKHFYAYFPLWLYVCSILLLIFPETWFFPLIKILILFFDLQVVILLFVILKPKVENPWRLKLPIAIWFITPIIIMTSSMHGKFDSLMFVFILIALLANEKKLPVAEGLFLSGAILTKPIMLLLVPFFFRSEIKEKNYRSFSIKLFSLIVPIILFSIPFLKEPLLYLKGVLGVHITRNNDMGLFFSLFKMIFPSANADVNIRISLTVVIVLFWVLMIIISFLKKIDLYTLSFLTFLGFNLFYWVFLVQYTFWIYTFYVLVSTKSKMKAWHIGLITPLLIILSTTALALLGTFVKTGL